MYEKHLLKMGISPSLHGFHYLNYALSIYEPFQKMTDLNKKISDHFGSTPGGVERAMRLAISKVPHKYPTTVHNFIATQKILIDLEMLNIDFYQFFALLLPIFFLIPQIPLHTSDFPPNGDTAILQSNPFKTAPQSIIEIIKAVKDFLHSTLQPSPQVFDFDTFLKGNDYNLELISYCDPMNGSIFSFKLYKS